MWGVLWLIIAFAFFAAGVIVGLAAFKVRPLTFLVPAALHSTIIITVTITIINTIIIISLSSSSCPPPSPLHLSIYIYISF